LGVHFFLQRAKNPIHSGSNAKDPMQYDSRQKQEKKYITKSEGKKQGYNIRDQNGHQNIHNGNICNSYRMNSFSHLTK